MNDFAYGALIGSASTIVGIIVLTAIVAKSRFNLPQQHDSKCVMKFAKGYLVSLGIGFLVFFNGTSSYLINLPESPPGEEIALAVLFVACTIFTFILFLRDGFFTSVSFDNEGFEKKLFTRSYKILWHQIQAVTYSNNRQSYVLATGNESVGVSKYLSGVGYFLEHLQSHCNEDILESIKTDLVCSPASAKNSGEW